MDAETENIDAELENGEEEETLSEEELLKRARRRKKLLRWVIVFVLLDVAIALFLSGRIQLDRQEIVSVRDAQAKKAGVSEQMTDAQREESIAIALGQAHASVTLRSEPHAVSGMVDIRLGNGEESPCAVTMQLVLAGTDDVLLSTGVIEPGYYLESARLSAEMAPGVYQCLARCLFYTMDDNAYLGTTTRQVLLRVE